jgi:hypothetical protein
MWNFAVMIVMGLCIVQNLRDPGRYGTFLLIIRSVRFHFDGGSGGADLVEG